jgi:hypothetical protein
VFLPDDEISCSLLDLKLELVYVAYFCKVGQPFSESPNTGQIDNGQGDLLIKKRKPSNV